MSRDQLDALALLLGLVAVAAIADIILVVLDDHLGGNRSLRHPVAILVTIALGTVVVVGLFVGFVLSRR